MKITIEIKDNHYAEYLEGFQKHTNKDLKKYIQEILYEAYYKGKKEIAIENAEPDVITTIVSVE